MIIGSNYFFQRFKDFKSKDKDYLYFVDKGSNYSFQKQVTSGRQCEFYVVRRPKEEIIQFNLKLVPMALGKFLIPEFNQEIGFTVEDLQKLKPLADNLDKEHQYEKVIFDYYIQNNEFSLTDDQLQEAYDVYKSVR